MVPFHELSRAAQFRRLAALARCALAAYDLGETSLSPLHNIPNTVWGVRCSPSGRRYVLRVHLPRRHDAAAIRSELLWLEALRLAGEPGVPVPVQTRGGGLWTLATAAGVPKARICTLLSWVPGRCERRRRTPTILGRMGRLMARLHERAAAYLPPGAEIPKRYLSEPKN